MLKGFKEFIMRGNVVELAVGVIIGGAFNNIVNALVEKVLNPLIGGIFGQPNFDSLGQFKLGDAIVMPGAILTSVIQFLLVAAALYFCIVMPMNKMAARAKSAAGEEAPPAKADEVVLLEEIRDLLSRR
ncbi:large conductance mechanosensitive channel protein MscL [Buchananella hordeovulneris]|uniref:large conductance mechanosensitive channel protein MscL n=1 Tax=Buchananella hordeovulneris TaxID=52770 RepID=UPI000F5F9C55|nr:large conductance mechanosensitive channel protein MscL [Buchananella hordeovulneris]RRD44277.1 large conductance mechanosensitive channel protein MscL [Buchananella hordeovulneris]RRD53303.1 large conductance mechanosensitive channel protein MscL [Buchananella hordeovulneris]